MAKLSIKDLELAGRRVFIRVDFNVPLKDGVIEDDTRIRASLPTIQYAIDHDATVVLASHLGRPKGRVDASYSLEPIAERLGQLLGRPVIFAEDCIGSSAAAAIAEAGRHDRVVLLENVRFHPEEEKNDPEFARQLAGEADLYVDDAFGAAHRAHASVAAITQFVKQAAAGLLMQQELRYLGHVIEAPERPFVVILGGAKVSDKIDVIDNLLKKVNRLLIGGAMAYTFLKSRGIPVGKSRVEEDKLDDARRIETDARACGVELALPVDHVVADRLDADAGHRVLAVGDAAIGDGIGVDIGPETRRKYTALIADARTVVWNGPMGVFEIPAFAAGTNAVATAVANVKGTTIVGGGDSIAAIKKAGLDAHVTHISTGGGASLEFLGGRTLPGVAALTDK
jgi:phosphoglycerate kinase